VVGRGAVVLDGEVLDELVVVDEVLELVDDEVVEPRSVRDLGHPAVRLAPVARREGATG
jgi:hypothetical protein